MERLGVERGMGEGVVYFFLPLMMGRGQSKYAGLLITLGDRSRYRSFIFIFFFRARESVHVQSCKQEIGERVGRGRGNERILSRLYAGQGL